MKGSIRTARISKRVNVLTEPMEPEINESSHFSAVPAYTYASPGSSQAYVMLKNLTARPVTVGQEHTVAVVKPGNEVPKMLALNMKNIDNESSPEVGPRVSKPNEGPQEGSCVYLKQSVGQPLEQKLLTKEQLKELHDKLQLKEYTAGWRNELKTELHELL